MSVVYCENFDVHIVGEKKIYKPHELKHVIEFNKSYEIECIKNRYEYDDFLQNTNNIMISDLIKIVYDYFADITNFDIFLSKSRYQADIYFTSHTHHHIHNFFTSECLLCEFYICANICPAERDYIIRATYDAYAAQCKCPMRCERYSANGVMSDNNAKLTKIYGSGTENINLMFTIFHSFAYSVKN